MAHITIGEIALLVREQFNISYEQMMGPCRARKLARPRQMAMALAREFTGCSYPQIGGYFDRDHTTVIYAVTLISKLSISKPKLAAHMENFRNSIREIAAANAAREAENARRKKEFDQLTAWKNSKRTVLVVERA